MGKEKKNKKIQRHWRNQIKQGKLNTSKPVYSEKHTEKVFHMNDNKNNFIEKNIMNTTQGVLYELK